MSKANRLQIRIGCRKRVVIDFAFEIEAKRKQSESKAKQNEAKAKAKRRVAKHWWKAREFCLGGPARPGGPGGGPGGPRGVGGPGPASPDLTPLPGTLSTTFRFALCPC